MRLRSVFAVVVVALLGALTFSATGQEDALAPVRARGALAPIEPTVFLAVEPIRDFQIPTLAEAARTNDYALFDALYTKAKERGENVTAYDAVHELWTYQMTSPIGAFYGEEMYARLARAYPGYAKFIADYKIVDSNGSVFYPTSETRAFLLDHTKTPAPTQLAEAVVVHPAKTPRPAKHRGGQALLPVPAKPKAERPAVTVAVPVKPVEKPVEVQKPDETATTGQAGVPVLHDNSPVAPVAQETPSSSRGILLLVIGLIGIGFLALLVRTPREEVKPAAPVEPIARKAATPTVVTPDEHRATGSHG